MKVHRQSGAILHQRPYRESSLLVDLFTRNYGRFMVIAKGCRRHKSRTQGLFMPFRPLLLGWAGMGKLPVLTSIEQPRFCARLDSVNLACGYYMNELILKLLHRHDPHEVLYDKYQEAIAGLLEDRDPDTVLRVFEKHFLQEIGFGLVLDHDVETGEAICEDRQYRYYSEKGPVQVLGNHHSVISGGTLTALRLEQFHSAEQHVQARRLMRFLIDRQLSGAPLRSRRVLREIRRYA